VTSTRLTAEHLGRRSIVYVRQSTPHQVQDNLESRRRQYALADLARGMGFASVEVIDDDLGISGSGAVSRPGFDRLFASLTTREVGAVFCLEASRLARNGREWHTLLDLCAVVAAVIVDPEGVYDPRASNDRLLLGLKGTLSEYELTLLRQRALSAIREKAARGELQFLLPVGLCWTRDGRIELTPDLRVQEAIRLVYRKYAEYGSMRKVLLWFHGERVMMPVRREGPLGEEIEWEIPVASTIHRTLTSPLYAGAYVWGRSQRKPTTGGLRGSRDVPKPMAEWTVVLRDHHPGYVTWSEYLTIRQKLEENAHMIPWSKKAGRGGRGLLTGLMRCRRCGHRIHTSYTGEGRAYYKCLGPRRQDGGSCLGFSGVHVEEAISEEVLRVIERPALDAALIAAESAMQRQQEYSKALELELEQARYRARLAERRFERADPDNRLVAPELERRWNESLQAVSDIEARIGETKREAATQPIVDHARLLELATMIPEIWSSGAGNASVKQRIVRILIEEILVDVDLEEGQVILLIHWTGGRHSEVRAKRRRQGQHRLTTSLETIEVVRRMGAYWDDKTIASTLNRLGMKTAKQLNWTEARVRSFRYANGLTDALLEREAKGEPAITLIEAAERLGTSTITVRKLIKKKILRAEQVVPFAPWRIPIAALEQREVLHAVAATKARRPRKHADDDRNLTIPGY
jgi:DNA invertase Pin-like site-specific DNA recombinase